MRQSNPKSQVLRTLLFVASGVGIFVLSGCGGARSEQSACQIDADCITGYVCKDSTCITNSDGNTSGGGCTHDADCPSDEYCDGGLCDSRNDSPTGTTCASHDDCAFGEFCNLATSACVACLNDDHCEIGLVCRSNGTCGSEEGCTTNDDCGNLVCETVSAQCVQCVSSGDCPDGQTCRGNACFVSDGGDPLCETQAECDPYGKICDTVEGRCGDCAADAECGEGKICAAGTCTIDGGTNPDDGGSIDGTCETTEDCNGDACFSGMCMPCFSDFMCVGLTDLLMGGGDICDPMTGKCIAPQCVTANDCAPKEACYGGGHCGTCEYDDECRSGEYCEYSTGLCEVGSTTPPSECTINSDCTGGLICFGGSCTNCDVDDDCDGSNICNDSNLCAAPGDTTPECTSNSGCTNGQVCISETCIACTSSTQCTSPNICTSGACTAPVTSECTDNNGCTGGQVCISDSCVACTSSTQCTSPNICTSGACTAPVTPECNDNSNCASHLVCISQVCTACTQDSQCDGTDYTCVSGICAPPESVSEVNFGGSCTYSSDCAAGLLCFGSDSDAICTHPCIGSGKGGDADCATGYTCYDYNSGALDGLMLCEPASWNDTDSGYPFTTAPGGSCTDESNSCQTNICLGSNTCARTCLADRDCGYSEVCWAEHYFADTVEQETIMTGSHYCMASELENYKYAGESCTDNYECDSGLCSGVCLDHCRSNADCYAGEACNPMTLDSANDEMIVPVCTAKYGDGTLADGAACTSYTECASDWCIRNICTTMCDISEDCTGNLSSAYCDPITFVDDSDVEDYSLSFCL